VESEASQAARRIAEAEAIRIAPHRDPHALANGNGISAGEFDADMDELVADEFDAELDDLPDETLDESDTTDESDSE
jgi:hypothetical protein